MISFLFSLSASYLSFELTLGTVNITHSIENGNETYTLFYPCTSNAICSPYYTKLPPGIYKIELWGASGGYSIGANPPGKCGYSVGALSIDLETPIFLHIGGRGTTGSTSLITIQGGYNGGGNGGFSLNKANAGGSGGGATDLRTFSDTLSSRKIVAGGGGGGGYYSGSSHPGGSGGGTSGGKADDSSSDGIGGGGGTQSQGGSSSCWNGATAGVFGQGGNASQQIGSYACGGGGGGYYGGGAQQSSNSIWGPSGGGGSGYIGGVIDYQNIVSNTIFGQNLQSHGYAKITILKFISIPSPTFIPIYYTCPIISMNHSFLLLFVILPLIIQSHNDFSIQLFPKISFSPL